MTRSSCAGIVDRAHGQRGHSRGESVEGRRPSVRVGSVGADLSDRLAPGVPIDLRSVDCRDGGGRRNLHGWTRHRRSDPRPSRGPRREPALDVFASRARCRALFGDHAVAHPRRAVGLRASWRHGRSGRVRWHGRPARDGRDRPRSAHLPHGRHASGRRSVGGDPFGSEPPSSGAALRGEYGWSGCRRPDLDVLFPRALRKPGDALVRLRGQRARRNDGASDGERNSAARRRGRRGLLGRAGRGFAHGGKRSALDSCSRLPQSSGSRFFSWRSSGTGCSGRFSADRRSRSG